MADPQNQVWKLFPAAEYLPSRIHHRRPCSTSSPSAITYTTLPPPPAFHLRQPCLPVCCQHGPGSIWVSLRSPRMLCFLPSAAGVLPLPTPPLPAFYKDFLPVPPFFSCHSQSHFLRALSCLLTPPPLQPDLCIQHLAELACTEVINNLLIVKCNDLFSGAFLLRLSEWSDEPCLVPFSFLGIYFLEFIQYVETRDSQIIKSRHMYIATVNSPLTARRRPCLVSSRPPVSSSLLPPFFLNTLGLFPV